MNHYNLNQGRGLPMYFLDKQIDRLNREFTMANDKDFVIGDTFLRGEDQFEVTEVLETRKCAGEWIGERPNFYRVHAKITNSLQGK
jgi:hypothetical protein